MEMSTSCGHIIKLKWNHRFFDDFRPGHVPLSSGGPGFKGVFSLNGIIAESITGISAH